ncbi:FAD-dependent oxidoreductase [Candidatus Babeliales bacterium]|nr:FAD-dependent oxidoreductase [Candidatus Babeliales bacterium]MCF7899816.1 FAD-dependent oxidoreductase [Candidatus Babeliales bacterium]
MRYLIIGASAAGIACASKLRDLDKESEIVVISDQKNLPYNKCILADYLAGNISQDRLFFKKQNFFQDNKINLLLSTKVIKIEPDKNKILTKSGQEFFYDKLFLGLGTRAFVPDIVQDIANIFTFQTFEDIEKISNFIKNNQVKNATIVGSGLTGLECSDVLSKMGIHVNLVIRSDKIMSKQLDKTGSEFIEKLIKKANINLLKNKTIKKINKNFLIEFSDNTQIQTDMIIFATGTIANTELALSANIKISEYLNGIIVNEFMQTNVENIYAGGDVCVIKNILTNKSMLNHTWPDATMQGFIAAYNMLGENRIYPGVLPTTSSNIFNTSFISCGNINCDILNTNNFCKIIEKRDQAFYHKFIIKNNHLIGFLQLGKIENVSKFKEIMLKKENFLLYFNNYLQ